MALHNLRVACQKWRRRRVLLVVLVTPHGRSVGRGRVASLYQIRCTYLYSFIQHFTIQPRTRTEWQHKKPWQQLTKVANISKTKRNETKASFRSRLWVHLCLFYSSWVPHVSKMTNCSRLLTRLSVTRNIAVNAVQCFVSVISQWQQSRRKHTDIIVLHTHAAWQPCNDDRLSADSEKLTNPQFTNHFINETFRLRVSNVADDSLRLTQRNTASSSIVIIIIIIISTSIKPTVNCKNCSYVWVWYAIQHRKLW